MEKIKQAVELARKQRAGGAQAGSRRQSHGGSEPRIVYNQTRTIRVNDELLRERRVILVDDNDAITDAYKVLRTHVLQRLRTNQWTTLAVTSPTKGNGKTLTSINLAISLAREVNQSVLLVDMDLRHPSIHSYFLADEHPGISEFLTDDTELSEILFNPGVERLVILPGNKTFVNSSEMLSSPKMIRLVDEIKSRYPDRIVLFDMPPLLSCDDMIAFSPYVDAIMLVVEEGVTLREELQRAYQLMDEKPIIGTVLNKSEDRGSAYGYY